jgi:hypothetical protein
LVLSSLRGRTLLETAQILLIGLMLVTMAGALAGVIARGDWRNGVVCVGAVIAILLPAGVGRVSRFKTPLGFQALLALFIYCAAFLGSVGDFYTRVPGWDIFLHAVSGALCAYAGKLLLLSEHPQARALFVGLFAATFALALGAVWEIYEFSLDQFLGQHMQMGANDTMHDIVADALGGLFVGVLLAMRHKPAQAATAAAKPARHNLSQRRA